MSQPDAKGRKETVAQEEGKTPRLEYRMPWIIFLPTVIVFFLLNYLAWFTTVNEDGTDLVMPQHVVDLKMVRDYKLTAEDDFFDPLLFLDDTVMRRLFGLARKIGGMSTVRVIWCVAWLVHCMELGIAVRIGVSCRATPVVFFVYCAMVLLGGITQLIPMIGARDKYLLLLGESKKKKNK